jgi:hypothetical protein
VANPDTESRSRENAVLLSPPTIGQQCLKVKKLLNSFIKVFANNQEANATKCIIKFNDGGGGGSTI